MLNNGSIKSRRSRISISSIRSSQNSEDEQVFLGLDSFDKIENKFLNPESSVNLTQKSMSISETQSSSKRRIASKDYDRSNHSDLYFNNKAAKQQTDISSLNTSRILNSSINTQTNSPREQEDIYFLHQQQQRPQSGTILLTSQKSQAQGLYKENEFQLVQGDSLKVRSLNKFQGLINQKEVQSGTSNSADSFNKKEKLNSTLNNEITSKQKNQTETDQEQYQVQLSDQVLTLVNQADQLDFYTLEQICKDFGIQRKILMSIKRVEEREDYVIDCINQSHKQYIQKWFDKINRKMLLIKEKQDQIIANSSREDAKTSLYQWVQLKNKHEAIEKHIKQQLVVQINEQSNQQMIEEYHTQNNKKQVQFFDQQYNKNYLRINLGIDDLKSSESAQEGIIDSNINKSQLIWDQEKEMLFDQYRSEARTRMYEHIKSSSCNRIGITPVMGHIYTNDRVENRRDRILKSYREGGQVQSSQAQFIMETSPLLNRHIDQEKIQQSVNQIDPKQLDQIELLISKKIIDQYQGIIEMYNKSRTKWLNQHIRGTQQHVGDLLKQRQQKIQLEHYEQTIRIKKKFLKKLQAIYKKKIQKVQESKRANLFVEYFLRQVRNMKNQNQMDYLKKQNREAIEEEFQIEQNHNDFKQRNMPKKIDAFAFHRANNEVITLEMARRFFHPPSQIFINNQQKIEEQDEKFFQERLDCVDHPFTTTQKGLSNKEIQALSKAKQAELDKLKLQYVMQVQQDLRLKEKNSEALLKFQLRVNNQNSFVSQRLFKQYYSNGPISEREFVFDQHHQKTKKPINNQNLETNEQIKKLEGDDDEKKQEKQTYFQVSVEYPRLHGWIDARIENEAAFVIQRMFKNYQKRKMFQEALQYLQGKRLQEAQGQLVSLVQSPKELKIENAFNFKFQNFLETRPVDAQNEEELQQMESLKKILQSQKRKQQQHQFRRSTIQIQTPHSPHQRESRVPTDNEIPGSSSQLQPPAIPKDIDQNKEKGNNQQQLYFKHLKIFKAVDAGDLNIVTTSGLTFFDEDINIQNEDGNTPLFIATMNSSWQFVEWLLGQKANVNERCQNGSTPMHMVFLSQSFNKVMQFLYHGGDLNIVNDSMQTPLAFGNSRLLQLLNLSDGYVYGTKNYIVNHRITNFDNNLHFKLQTTIMKQKFDLWDDKKKLQFKDKSLIVNKPLIQKPTN